MKLGQNSILDPANKTKYTSAKIGQIDDIQQQVKFN
jgi:hypothetical protein